ncbi:ribonuclease P protein component [Candidatus Peregrinibacteria bacterium]|nr:ribonuclease P protein component [Candidatus Peregrinibacteria bacterium]
MISKKYRIDRNLIDYILKKGESDTSNLFIIRYIKNNKDFCRYRTIVSSKLNPKAVIRNKIKREIYEAIRIITKDKECKETLDIVLIPKKQIKEAKYQEIEKDLEKIIKKHGKIK